MKNKVVLVTGSSGTLGKAIVKLLINRGATVIGQYNNNYPNELESNLYMVKSDLTCMSGIKDIVNYISEHFGKLDVLINNAAIISYASIEEVNDIKWNEQIALNVKAPFYLAREFYPYLVKSKSSSIVNICSITALAGAVSVGMDYVATKGALLSMTRGLAKLWADERIRVNAVLPGPFESQSLQSSPLFQNFEKLFEHGKLPDPEGIAQAVIFLASEESRLMTGTAINISDGLFIY